MLRTRTKFRLRILPLLLMALVFPDHHVSCCSPFPPSRDPYRELRMGMKASSEKLRNAMTEATTQITRSILDASQRLERSAQSLNDSSVDNSSSELRMGMKESSDKLQNAMMESTNRITSSIMSASQSLERSAQTIASSLDTASKELGQSIRKASGDLVQIADRLGNSVDNGIKELGDVMRDAISATKMISQDITKLGDNLVAKAGKQLEQITNEIRDIAKDLTNSIERTFQELEQSVRYIGDRIVDISKQFEMNANSGDLIKISNATRQELVEAVGELTTNWKVAIKAMDLKDVEQGAAAEVAVELKIIKMTVTRPYCGPEGNDGKLMVLAENLAGIAFFIAVFILLILGSLIGCSIGMDRILLIARRVGRKGRRSASRYVEDGSIGQCESESKDGAKMKAMEEGKLLPSAEPDRAKPLNVQNIQLSSPEII